MLTTHTFKVQRGLACFALVLDDKERDAEVAEYGTYSTATDTHGVKYLALCEDALSTPEVFRVEPVSASAISTEQVEFDGEDELLEDEEEGPEEEEEGEEDAPEGEDDGEEEDLEPVA